MTTEVCWSGETLVTNFTFVRLLSGVCLSMLPQVAFGRKPQLTVRQTANMIFTSLVPAAVRFELGWHLERTVTPRFLALVVVTFSCLVYTYSRSVHIRDKAVTYAYPLLRTLRHYVLSRVRTRHGARMKYCVY
jgi:hypothetical protein